MTPPARPRVESRDLAVHYEALRRSALDPSSPHDGRLGLGLLVRNGVAAWIAASCASFTQPTAASSAAPAADGCGCARSDLVRVLVSMVLAPTMEHAR